VLVVEDSEDDAALLVRELRRGGYEPALERVDTPEGMERALRKADGRGAPFEVVIFDYYMPRFRAPDALALLRGLGHDVPFIVISGKIGEDAAVGVLKGRPALDATASAGAGGELEIESEPGEGTRVRFRVPITRLVQG
jgi:CheY-like chemotaxis protein